MGSEGGMAAEPGSCETLCTERGAGQAAPGARGGRLQLSVASGWLLRALPLRPPVPVGLVRARLPMGSRWPSGWLTGGPGCTARGGARRGLCSCLFQLFSRHSRGRRSLAGRDGTALPAWHLQAGGAAHAPGPGKGGPVGEQRRAC